MGLALLAGNALAEHGTVRLTIDGLDGTYVAIPRQVDFQTARVDFVPPTELIGMRFRLAGTAIPGELGCAPGGVGSPGVQFTVYIALPGSPTSYWAFEIPLWDQEEFELEADLLPFHPVEVRSILLSGDFVVTLRATGGLMSDCGYIPPYPEATVTAAILLVEGEYAVPTASMTWSGIQAQFR